VSNIVSRIEKLEKHTGAGKQQPIRWVLYEGQPEPTEAQREAAIADYKAKHPDWEGRDTIVIYVNDAIGYQLANGGL